MATDERESRLMEVVEETGARCPVMNLLRDARVAVWMEWVSDS